MSAQITQVSRRIIPAILFDVVTCFSIFWIAHTHQRSTRLKPGARIILIQTRRHEDDLAGRLIAEMEAVGSAGKRCHNPQRQSRTTRLGASPASGFGTMIRATSTASFLDARRSSKRRETVGALSAAAGSRYG